MYSARIFTWLTIIIYLFASTIGLFGMTTNRILWRKTGCWLAVAAFCCQTFFLIMGFHKTMPDGLSSGAYLQMLAWFFLGCGIIAWWRYRQDAIMLFAAPLGLIFFLMSLASLDISVPLPKSLSAPFFALHIGALFLGLGMLALAFIAAIFFIFIQKRIKAKKHMQGFWQDMPALALLDKINAACIIGAFPCYTAGIIAGLFWGPQVFGSMFNGDPKEIVSLIIWLLLAILFHNRLATGWKGRKPAIFSIIIFLLSAFSIVVINIYFPTQHAFIRG